MKIFATTVLGLVLLCLLPFTLGEVEHYKMALEEKGTKFSERIDIDEQQDFEVFQVPAHNDVDGADFYHDFKMRVTVTRIQSRKVCYVSELDPAMSSPAKLKADLNRAAFQVGKLPVQTKLSLVMISGPANRLLLTKEILDFCGALPIYSTERIKVDPSNGNRTTIIRRRRQKRDLTVIKFKSCLKTLQRNPFEFVMRDGCMDPHKVIWDISCRMEPRLQECFYFVTCDDLSKFKKYEYSCTDVHESSISPACCDYICPID